MAVNLPFGTYLTLGRYVLLDLRTSSSATLALADMTWHSCGARAVGL